MSAIEKTNVSGPYCSVAIRSAAVLTVHPAIRPRADPAARAVRPDGAVASADWVLWSAWGESGVRGAPTERQELILPLGQVLDRGTRRGPSVREIGRAVICRARAQWPTSCTGWPSGGWSAAVLAADTRSASDELLAGPPALHPQSRWAGAS